MRVTHFLRQVSPFFRLYVDLGQQSRFIDCELEERQALAMWYWARPSNDDDQGDAPMPEQDAAPPVKKPPVPRKRREANKVMSYTISVRMTPEEQAKLVTLQVRFNLNIAQVVRKLIADAPRARTDAPKAAAKPTEG